MRKRGLLLALLLAMPAPGAAQRAIIFEEFHSDVQVLPDGDLLVTETLRPRFTGSWNGIRRIVGLEPPSSYAPDYLLDARLISATDETGRSLRHKSSRLRRDAREFRIWVPDAEDRTATVVLTYRVGNALGHFEADSASGTPAWDELYWQATGTEWDVPILSASARVRVPSGAAPMQAAAYVGDAGNTGRATVQFEGGVVVAVGPVGTLRPGEGLTLAVGWPAGHVARPAPGDRGGSHGPPSPLVAWPLLVPILAFWLAHRAWNRRGRDPTELAITTHWEPPAGLTPAEAGTLVDHQAGIHDIVSTLVDLAVKGFLVIEEREKGGFLASGKDYAFHAIRPRAEWVTLPEHERLFLEGLFDAAKKGEAAAALAAIPGIGALVRGFVDQPEAAPDGAYASVELSDLKNEFYKTLPKITDALQRSLVDRGYYLTRPDKVRQRWMAFAALSVGAGFSVTPLLANGEIGALTGVLFPVSAFITAVILAIFGWLMPARTEAGARAREAVLGFKRFLERVEAPRYRRMITSPDVFEAYLPYAIAFRCEERWAGAFEGMVTEPPHWYRGTHMTTFRPATFASDLGTLSTAARSTLSSSPSSSGSGGGGSVGGGGGGGGGGGF